MNNLHLYFYSKLYKSEEGEDKLIKYGEDDAFVPNDFKHKIMTKDYTRCIRTAYDIKSFDYKKLGEGGFNCVYTINNTIFRLLKNDIFLRIVNSNNIKHSEWADIVTKTRKLTETQSDTTKKNLGFFGFHKDYEYVEDMNAELLGLHIQRILCSNNDIRSVYICDVDDYGLYSFKETKVDTRDKSFLENPANYFGQQDIPIPDIHKLSPLGVYANIESLIGYCELKDWYIEKKNILISAPADQVVEQGGSLEAAIRINKKKHFKDVINITTQLLRGLEYIQGYGEDNFLHLDLKAQNIMINWETNRIKFIDFGFIQDTKSKHLMCGDLRYYAPECEIRHPGPVWPMTQPRLYIDKTTDIWYLGHIVYELLTFTTLDSGTIYKKVNPMSKSDKNDKTIYLEQIYKIYGFYQTGSKFKKMIDFLDECFNYYTPRKIEIKKKAGLILPKELKRKTASELKKYIPKKIRYKVLVNETLYWSEKKTKLILILDAKAKALEAKAQAQAQAQAEEALKAEADEADKLAKAKRNEVLKVAGNVQEAQRRDSLVNYFDRESQGSLVSSVPSTWSTDDSDLGEASSDSDYDNDDDNEEADLEERTIESLNIFENLVSLIKSSEDITEKILMILNDPNFYNLSNETILETLCMIEVMEKSVVTFGDEETTTKYEILHNIGIHKETIEGRINIDRWLNYPIYHNTFFNLDYFSTTMGGKISTEETIMNENGQQVNRFLLTTKQPNINISANYVNIGPLTKVVAATLGESVKKTIILGRKAPAPPPPQPPPLPPRDFFQPNQDMIVDMTPNILQLNGVKFLPENILPPIAFR